MDMNADSLEEGRTFRCPLWQQAPADWAAVEAVFVGVPGLPLHQAWREDAEPGFLGGAARMARTADALLVAVELEDADVFNPVSAFNEPAFLRGDVVEIFLLPEGTDRYIELHTTPDGVLFQLRCTVGWRARCVPGAPLDFRDRLVALPVAKVLTRRTSAGWSAYLEIPFALTESVPLPRAVWRASVCRYDYTRGREQPVLSSTSALTKLDFHQTDCWDRLVFV